jgi:hypothetical protein
MHNLCSNVLGYRYLVQSMKARVSREILNHPETINWVQKLQVRMIGEKHLGFS